jgi:hypothetical protein
MLQAHIHGECDSGYYCGRSSPRTVGPEPYRGSAGVALHKLANVHIYHVPNTYDKRSKVPQPFASEAAVLRLSEVSDVQRCLLLAVTFQRFA